MKVFRIILVIALLLTIAILANAALAFYNGNEYLKWSKNEKIYYVAGICDMQNALINYYEPEKYKKIYELIKDMALGQIILILDKYLEENPEELHKSVAVSFLNAIDEIVYK